MRLGDTMLGYPIVDVNGRDVGRVKEIAGGCLKVDAPMAPDYWLPDDCVASVNGGVMTLALDRDHLGDYKTDRPDNGRSDTFRDTEMAHSAGTMDATLHRDMSMGTTAGADRDTMRLHEERLHATTRPTQAGEVRIGKEIVSEERSIEVPVHHEEVVIERHPVDAASTPGELHDTNRDREIRVPIMEEHVEIEKHTVPVEEVSIGKRQVQETQRVTATVHREEARLEHTGDVPVHGWNDVSTGYHQRWQGSYGRTGGRWEDFEPGYRYGYEMRNDPRYRGRHFSEAEPDLRNSYTDWSRRSGYNYDDSAWDRMRMGIEEAFDDTGGEIAA
jgi:uncharacterized protein (TIGR02271 family)